MRDGFDSWGNDVLHDSWIFNDWMVVFYQGSSGRNFIIGGKEFQEWKTGRSFRRRRNGYSEPLMDDFFAQFLKGDFDDPVSQCGHEPRDGQSDKEERGEVKVRNERPLANWSQAGKQLKRDIDDKKMAQIGAVADLSQMNRETIYKKREGINGKRPSQKKERQAE